MVDQSCLTCKKQNECPKAGNFENYYLDGCSEHEDKENDDEVL